AQCIGYARQLQNVIDRAVTLTEAYLLREGVYCLDSHPPHPLRVSGVLELDSGLLLREVERRYILRTLISVGGSRTVAAKRLGISLRCLQYKLKFYSEQDQANGHANGAQDAPNHRSVPDLEPGMSL